MMRSTFLGFRCSRSVAQFDQRFAVRLSTALDLAEPARGVADDVLDNRGEGELTQWRGHGVPPVAHDRRAIGDSHDLVHAMRDVDDRDAVAPQPAQKHEQPIDLRGGQRRGRLVEDEDAASLGERLDDFRQLSLTGAEFDQRRLGVDGDAELVEQLCGSPERCVSSSTKPKRPCGSRLRKMFWATLSVGIRLISWKIIATPARRTVSALCYGSRLARRSRSCPKSARQHAAQNLQ